MAIVKGGLGPTDPHIDNDAEGPYNKRAYRVTLVDQSGNPVTSLGGGGGSGGTVNQGTGNNASPWFVQWTGQSVSISNFPATQTVSVNNFPATQPVSGTVTANAGSGTFTVGGTVSVSNFPTTQTISGSVSVSNFPANQSVTQGTSPWVTNITQLGGTNISLNAGATDAGTQRVVVSGMPPTPDVVTNGLQLDLTTIGNVVVVPIAAGTNTLSLTATNVTGSGATFRLEQSSSPSTVIPRFDRSTMLYNGTTITADVAGMSAVYPIGGVTSVRLRVTAAGTGTATINATASYATLPFAFASAPVAPGTAPPTSTLVGALYNSATVTYTNGQAGSLLVDVNGALKVVQTYAGNQAPAVGTGVGSAITNVPRVAVAYDSGVGVTAGVGGAALIFRLPSSAASTNATNIKTTAARLYKIRGYNTTNAIIRLKLYSKGTAPTVGTDAIFDVFVFTPGYNSFDLADIGWYLANGLSFSLVTGSADTDATAVTAGAVTDLSMAYA